LINKSFFPFIKTAFLADGGNDYMRKRQRRATNNSYNHQVLIRIFLVIAICGLVVAYYWNSFSEGFSSTPIPRPRTIRWIQDHLYDLHFINKNNGWVVGDYGTILTTKDGGKSWIRQESGTNALLRGVDFIDEKRGWAVGVRGTVLHTEDGGKTWVKQQIDTKHLHSIDPDIYFRDVDFIDEFKGWIIARTGSIFITQDGGKHWQEQSLNGKEARLNRIRFFTRQVGWIVGEFGSLFVTRNGGQFWQAKQSGTNVTLMDIAFLNPQVGYVVGLNGTLLRTQDGGKTWETISTGSEENFFGLCIDHKSKRILILGNRFLQWFDSHNGNKLSWHETILPATVNLLETWFYSAQANAHGDVWIVSRKGKVLYCSNGGESCQSMLNWDKNVFSVKGGA
jgi:hypothetical protein